MEDTGLSATMAAMLPAGFSSSGLSVLLSSAASLDNEVLDWELLTPSIKEEVPDLLDDSLANSPASILSCEEDATANALLPSSTSSSIDCCDFNASALYGYDSLLGLTDPMMALPKEEKPAANVVRRQVMVRKRMRECSMVCWLFRTLLTSEYRALPLNAIFEIFEDTNPSAAHGRHWRQSIRHCLMSSAVFVRVLTPNPRKDFLVMNEAGSWWTVHPDCETACAEDVFRPGVQHKCPPNGATGMVRMMKYRVEDANDIIYRDGMTRDKYSEKTAAAMPPTSRRRTTAQEKFKPRKALAPQLPQAASCSMPGQMSAMAPLRPSSISLFSQNPSGSGAGGGKAPSSRLTAAAGMRPNGTTTTAAMVRSGHPQSRSQYMVVDHEEEVN